MTRPINPRPGVVVCAATAKGKITTHEPGAYARREWERHEKERQAKKEAKNDDR